MIVSTYQAVSGAGKASVDELLSQTKDYLDKKRLSQKISQNKLRLILYHT